MSYCNISKSTFCSDMQFEFYIFDFLHSLVFIFHRVYSKVNGICDVYENEM